jgi:predicted metal-binding membrane protein
MSSDVASVNLRAPLSPTLLLLAATAWVLVIVIGHGMSATMTGTMGYGFVAFVGIWSLMMAAMMLPSINPFVAVYTRTFATARSARTVSFVTGYLVIWAVAGVPAYAIGRAADQLVANHTAGATALAVIAFASCGVYQLTPMKDRCLAWCRSPLGFTLKYSAYRGRTRDFRVGLHHGAFCLACCWALTVLLLAFGVMNVFAMIAIAAIVYFERMTSWGPRLGRLLGVAALLLAVAVIFRPEIAPALHHHDGPTMQMGMP